MVDDPNSTAEPPSSDTLRGLVAAAPAPESVPTPPAEADDAVEAFRAAFNRCLVGHGLKLIAAGRTEGRLQRGDVDCVWQLRPAGVAYQFRYLDSAADGVAPPKPGVIRGAPVSEPFRPMGELREIARLLASALAEEAELLPGRIEARRKEAEAQAKWERDKAAADAREIAAQRAAQEAEREADRKLAEEAARQARESALLKQNKRDAAELTDLLPEGWTAFPTGLASSGNVVLQTRSVPPAFVRELAAVLPPVDRASDYAELRTFLDQVRRWRALERRDQYADLNAQADKIQADIQRKMDEQRRRDSSLLGRALSVLGLTRVTGARSHRRRPDALAGSQRGHDDTP